MIRGLHLRHECPGDFCSVCAYEAQKFDAEKRYHGWHGLKRKIARPQGKSVLLQVKGVIHSRKLDGPTRCANTNVDPDHAAHVTETCPHG